MLFANETIDYSQLFRVYVHDMASGQVGFIQCEHLGKFWQSYCAKGILIL